MDIGLATAFIVTGTVPDPNEGVPQDHKRVTVPSHIWTAVCYKHHIYDAKSISFGYIGRNQQEEPGIRLMSVSDLNNELRSHFRTNQPIEIFADDCFSDNNNELVEVQSVFKNQINLPVSQADQTSSGLQDTYLKSLLLSHHHSTSALVSEILMSVLQTVQKKTTTIYKWTDCTEDNVQNTHTYTSR